MKVIRHCLPRAISSVLLAALCWATAARADEIYFASGETLKGLVVEEHVDRLVVSTVDGERTVWRLDVDQVFFDDPERNYLYLGNEALAGGDVNAAMTLYQKAIQLNPAWGDARDALRRLDDQQRRMTRAWAVEDSRRALQMAWGLTLSATENYPVVTTMAPPAGAAGAGLQTGDAVVAVWGESMGYRPLAQVAGRLAGPAGTEVKITVRRDVTVRAAEVPNAPWPGFGVSMTPAGLTVSDVGMLGTAAGVQVGDIIVTLDGRPTRYLPLGAARAVIDKARAAGLRLQIHRHLLITRPTSSS